MVWNTVLRSVVVGFSLIFSICLQAQVEQNKINPTSNNNNIFDNNKRTIQYDPSIPFDTIIPKGFTIREKQSLKGLDYYIDEKDEIDIVSSLPAMFHNDYNALVVGGSYFTKQIPVNKLKEICATSSLPLILLGGTDDATSAEQVYQLNKNKVLNLCGKLNLNQSASIIQQANKVITSDTGLMHIAAAYKKDIISLWGNTIPEFGMGPYLAGKNSQILEVTNLSCRPCSKLGYKKCPKGHFKCMNDIQLKDAQF